MSTQRKNRKLSESQLMHPTPARRPTREELEGMMMGLPAMLRGPAEVTVYLKLSDTFVKRWLSGPLAGIPAMPHFCMKDGVPVLNTAQVLVWLAQWFPPGSGERSGRGKRQAFGMGLSVKVASSDEDEGKKVERGDSRHGAVSAC